MPVIHQQAGDVNGMRTDVANPESEVSLYLTLISAAVTRIAAMASSKVTLNTPSEAIANCAAVIALTAEGSHGRIVNIDTKSSLKHSYHQVSYALYTGPKKTLRHDLQFKAHSQRRPT